MIKNRIQKNHNKLAPWASRNKIEAFRLYDRDIPEYPFIVDKYKDHFVIYDKSDFVLDANKNFLPQVIMAVKELFPESLDRIIVKERIRQSGLNQYEKEKETGKFFNVQETQAQLSVNLWDYLDTGLFLDHRPMRQKIFKEANGKNFLNLFCYTGSVSVFAALGGATTTNIDMSATYIEWAQKNFELNNIDISRHEFIQADVMAWLDSQVIKPNFDLIFLDPPTFSNSKRMQDNFEVERDQEKLILPLMRMLRENGVLYFSNNKRKFKLSDKVTQYFFVKDITFESIPKDFHDQKIHHCYLIKNLLKQQ